MSDPIDLDAVLADADQEPHSFVLADMKFEIPQLRDWPHEATFAFDRGHIGAALKQVMGDDWDRLVQAADSVTGHGPTYRIFEALADEMARREGFADAGNSRRSARSSRSTTKT